VPLEVLDLRIAPGKEETLVAVVTPAHEVRRISVLAADLEDLRVAIRLADVVALDDQTITDFRVHRAFLSLGIRSLMVREPSAGR
jgi:hypothetical protein